ncbi:MAG: dTMP kinase [Chloroflexota bacterium]
MFISFEGIDGCGKSTQARLLGERLTESGLPTLALREPGSTPFSEYIRSALLEEDYDLSPQGQLFLFEAARAELTDKVIRPALADGKIVIADRFFDSTTAYQGYGRGLPIEEVEKMNLFATSGLEPDITFYLSLSYEESLARTHNKKKDTIEQYGEEFFRRVIGGFDQIAERSKGRVVTIRSTHAVAVTFEKIMSIVEERLTVRK